MLRNVIIIDNYFRRTQEFESFRAVSSMLMPNIRWYSMNFSKKFPSTSFSNKFLKRSRYTMYDRRSKSHDFISSLIINGVPCLNWFQMFRKTPNSFNEISASFRFPSVIFLRKCYEKITPVETCRLTRGLAGHQGTKGGVWPSPGIFARRADVYRSSKFNNPRNEPPPPPLVFFPSLPATPRITRVQLSPDIILSAFNESPLPLPDNNELRTAAD